MSLVIKLENLIELHSLSSKLEGGIILHPKTHNKFLSEITGTPYFDLYEYHELLNIPMYNEYPMYRSTDIPEDEFIVF